MNKGIYYLLFLIILSPFALLAQGKKLGKVTDPVLSELSGIIPYSYQPGYFWVHNDSGDDGQIYLIDREAKLSFTLKLEGIKVEDCEDIARLTIDGVPHLLLADIGNNQKKRSTLSLYLFPEPQIAQGVKYAEVPSHSIKKLDIRYAIKPRDAEAIFVDPLTQEVYIVSKRDFKSTVFSFPIEKFNTPQQMVELKPQLELPFTFVTSADISPDGHYVLIKNLTTIYMWKRTDSETLLKTLSQPAKKMPYSLEPQGEAICFDLEEPYFYTISEKPLGLPAYLIKYPY